MREKPPAPRRSVPWTASMPRARPRSPATRSRRAARRGSPRSAGPLPRTSRGRARPERRSRFQRSTRSRAGIGLAVRFMATKSISPIVLAVCLARCRPRLASSIGVTGWCDMTGCSSSRYPTPFATREQVAEGLIAAHAGVAHHHGLPNAAQDGRSDVDRAPDRPDMRGGVEGGADLVMCDRRAERPQQLEDRGQMAVHPRGALGARDAGNADDATIARIAPVAPASAE